MNDNRTREEELAAGPQAGPGARKGMERFRSPEEGGGGSEDRLREELREAVGDDADSVSDRQIARAAERRPAGFASKLRDNMLLVAITFGVALVVGAVLALSLESWWLLVAALLVHAVATVIVVGMTLQLSTQVEKPDPATVADLEARGVTNPEGTMNELVEEAAGEEDRSDAERLAAERGDRTAPSGEGSDAERVAQQQKSTSPVSEDTRPAGPGS